jgi:peptidoglycan-N-acetylglucosamine deacetylase
MALRLAVAGLLSALAVPARTQAVWPQGRTAAVVLTYDDALRSQLEVAVPQLDDAGFKGSFFLDGDITPDDMLRWRRVGAAGHELGNHSLFHPCPRGLLPGRVQYQTDDYDVPRMLAEIAAMNNVLFGVGAVLKPSYSVPCSQMQVGGTDYTEPLRRSGLVSYVRTGGDAYRSVVTDLAKLDPFQVPSWGPVDRPDGAQLVAYVERVRTARGLGVLQFHGVGGDYLDVSAEAHAQLLKHLRSHPEIWVGTFREVMDHVASITSVAPAATPTRPGR